MIPNNITKEHIIKAIQEIDTIVNGSLEYEFQKAIIMDEGNTDKFRKSNIKWLPFDSKWEWVIDKIMSQVTEANKTIWNFDLKSIIDNIQYTEYEGNGGHYDWHLDLGPGLSNRKLSVVLQLSDPNDYVGGDLEMNVGGSILKVPKEKGLICFFPSFLLHRVTPLSSGTRTSLVTWLCGANLR